MVTGFNAYMHVAFKRKLLISLQVFIQLKIILHFLDQLIQIYIDFLRTAHKTNDAKYRNAITEHFMDAFTTYSNIG